MDCFKLEILFILFWNLEVNEGESKVDKRENNCALNNTKRDMPYHVTSNTKYAALSDVINRIRQGLIFVCLIA
jgi:hypothetical protein